MAQEFSYSQAATEPAPEVLEAKEKKRDFLKEIEIKAKGSYSGVKQKIENYQEEQREKRMMTVKSRLENLKKNQAANELEAEAMDLEARDRAHRQAKREAMRERIRAIFSPLKGLGGGGQPARGGRARQPRYANQGERLIYQQSPNAAALLGQGTGSNASRLLMNEGQSNASRLLFGGGNSNASRLLNSQSNSSRMLFSNRQSNASRLLLGGSRSGNKPDLLGVMMGRKESQRTKRGITIHIGRR